VLPAPLGLTLVVVFSEPSLVPIAESHYFIPVSWGRGEPNA
jgi:hypothetical protein